MEALASLTVTLAYQNCNVLPEMLETLHTYWCVIHRKIPNTLSWVHNQQIKSKSTKLIYPSIEKNVV